VPETVLTKRSPVPRTILTHSWVNRFTHSAEGVVMILEALLAGILIVLAVTMLAAATATTRT
jgi:hypothetical protein